MRISIALSILILLVAGVAGWKQHDRIVRIREVRNTLVAEAGELGIQVDPENSLKSSSTTKRGERKDKSGEAEAAAREFIAFAKRMEEMEAKGEQPDEETQKRMMAFFERLMSLDSAQLRIMVEAFRDSKDLNDENRANLVGFSILSLSERNPAAALALATESADAFKGKGFGPHVVSASLGRWAKDDPMAALEWARKNGGKFPVLVTDDAKEGLVRGAAKTDPKLAFRLLGELGLKERAGVIQSIAQEATTPEERTAMLEALRSREKDGGDSGDQTYRGVGAFASGLVKEGFENAIGWLDKSQLRQEEVEEIAVTLQGQIKGPDTGKWIGWVGDSLPPDKARPAARNIMRTWTQKDYKAAGEWLGSAPAGPVRDESVRTYAETISRYEPEAAEQWALTLPDGKERNDTLRKIHQNWRKDDDASKAAAEEFKTRHGIK